MIKIENIRLCDYVNDVQSKEFEYSGVNGSTEFLGWYIIVFSEYKSNLVSAVSFDDILSDIRIIKIANDILKRIDFPILFGDDFSLIKKLFGNPISLDTVLTNITRYHYFSKEDSLYMCFGIENKNKTLCSLELITNSKIIKNREF
jgi:hypothetical protein